MSSTWRDEFLPVVTICDGVYQIISPEPGVLLSDLSKSYISVSSSPRASRVKLCLLLCHDACITCQTELISLFHNDT